MNELTIEEFDALSTDTYVLYDIRSTDEINHGAIKGAIASSAEELEENPPEEKGKKIIICCSRGRVSCDVAENLCEQGYDAVSLKGGYIAWLMAEIKKQEADEICDSVEKSLRKKFHKNIFSKFAKAINQYELVKEKFPEVEYDPISRILKIEKKDKKRIGKIAVCSAGTADIPVAEEAAQTAEYFGTNVERIYDVGVSGMHRLFSRLETIQSANCVIAVAGMEGALASVMGGLVSRPVIAVPTSVGYGASMHGLSALLTMINSCANGIAVVNIDNGYGAGYLATQINRLAAGTDEKGN